MTAQYYINWNVQSKRNKSLRTKYVWTIFCFCRVSLIHESLLYNLTFVSFKHLKFRNAFFHWTPRKKNLKSANLKHSLALSDCVLTCYTVHTCAVLFSLTLPCHPCWMDKIKYICGYLRIELTLEVFLTPFLQVSLIRFLTIFTPKAAISSYSSLPYK